MENKQQLLHRLAALLVMLLLCAGLAGSRLVDLQLVHGQEYLERSAQFLTTTSTVSAARGEILDRYGRPMVSNKTGFSLVLLYSDFWENKEDKFDRLLDLAQRVQADAAAGLNVTGDVSKTLAAAKKQAQPAQDEYTDETEEEAGEARALLNDMLPISASAPYTYTAEAGSSSMSTLSAYIKDSCETLGLTAVQTAVRQAREAPAEYDTDGNAIDKTKQIDATALVSPTEFVAAMGKYMTESSAWRQICRRTMCARSSACITACVRSASARPSPLARRRRFDGPHRLYQGASRGVFGRRGAERGRASVRHDRRRACARNGGRRGRDRVEGQKRTSPAIR